MGTPLFRTATAVILAAFMAFVVAADVRADGTSRVVVRMLDTADNDIALRAAAMRTTSAIMTDAGITIEWRDCSHDGDRTRCREPRGTHDLIVRVVPRHVEAANAPPAGSNDGAVATDGGLHLGFAVLDTDTRTGVLATVYHDRVLATSSRTHLAYSDLLGRAMAHEIGHLLLHAAGHGPSGLMRAVWTEDELTRNQRTDWRFAPAEQRQMVQGTRDSGVPEHRTSWSAWPRGLAARRTSGR